ncbi:MAG: hypothetical protein KDA24_05735 [Deltaproteobacteria bacterium]|nr:hypothetical protein [Deltaproteobacteria bacterium]
MSVVSATCYELLGVPVHASRSELAEAWKQERTSLQKRPDSYTSEEVEALCARLDEAFAILSDPEQSARYRAYVAQQDGTAAPWKPADFIGTNVAAWGARSTQIPAPAAVAPELPGEPPAPLEIPADPPPWLVAREPHREPVEALVEEAVQALADQTAARAPAEEPPVIEDAADALDPDTVNTFDEWGAAPDDSVLARTVPMGPAAAKPPPPDLSSLTRLAGRRPVRTMPPVRTRPASKLPQSPDED